MRTQFAWSNGLAANLRNDLRALLLIVAVGSIAISIAACDQPSGQASQPPPKLEVRVAKPVVKPITEWDEYTGQFDAIERVEIRARVSGYLDDINFDDGQLVEKDDLLFVIDQRPFLIALQTAEAELEQARASVQRTEKDLERAQTLRQGRNISQSVVDERFAEARIARASLQAAEAAVARARLDLEFTEVKAPISGRIGRELVTHMRDYLTPRANVILNLADVTYLNSEAIGFITACARRQKHRDGGLSVCCLRPGPREVFKILRMEQVLAGIHDTETDAISAFQKPTRRVMT